MFDNKYLLQKMSVRDILKKIGRIIFLSVLLKLYLFLNREQGVVFMWYYSKRCFCLSTFVKTERERVCPVCFSLF
jgi:hypothetical protein